MGVETTSCSQALNIAGIVGQKEQGFDAGKFRNGFGRGLSQTIDTDRPGANNPELVEVLRNDVELMALVDKAINSIEGR